MAQPPEGLLTITSHENLNFAKEVKELRISLGGKYHDTVTLFHGTATARCEYLTGAPRVLLETLAHDGKAVKSDWFDETRLAQHGAGLAADCHGGEDA